MQAAYNDCARKDKMGALGAYIGRAMSGPVRVAAAGSLVLAFVGVGALGLVRYGWNFWLYRGFSPPQDPAFVKALGDVGTTRRVYIASPALGGRRQAVDVYLPPGYATDPLERYPVFYLLHGFPGRPAAFLQTVRLGVVEDVLLARSRIRPMILVMPFGSTGTFTDKEWVNGVRKHEGWASFVARDLVRAIDSRYRTIPDGAQRILGGLSEGGYGALNIGLQHPGEFRVLESWSGYEQADDIRSIFGGKKRLLRLNSPLATLPGAATALKAARTFIWFYSGSTDRLRKQNVEFARELTQLGIPFRFSIVRGGHNWALWRGRASLALLAASEHLPRG
jgi:enterochelin esterase-like enzyme